MMMHTIKVNTDMIIDERVTIPMLLVQLWVVITNKSQTQAQTQDGVLYSGFNLRLRNGDYQNPEIVFILRPEHKTQES